jgi:transposase-like protein
LPDKAWEGFPKRLNKSLMGVAGRHFDAGETAALEVLEDGLFDATAVLALPGKYRRRLRTTNMLERFIEEIRRREKVIRIFPNLSSVERFVGALCVETHEEWCTGRRYLKMDEFFEWKEMPQAPDSEVEEATEPALVAA